MAIQKTFTIENTGGAVLNISNVTVPTGFSLPSSYPSTVAAEDEEDLIVQLDTAVAGTKSGNVTITSDDLDEGTYTFAITGIVTALAPDIDVENNGTTITVGEDMPIKLGTASKNGTVKQKIFVIENTGNAVLNISSVTVPTGFSLPSGFPKTVAASGSANLLVQLNTTNAGSFSGDVVIYSDDLDEGTYNFAIDGYVSTVTNEPILTKVATTTAASSADLTPRITFQANLNPLFEKVPFGPSGREIYMVPGGNLSQAIQLAATRQVQITGRSGGVWTLGHTDRLTVGGKEAIYLRDQYTNSNGPPKSGAALLTIVE